jgi:DNA-damage-inducible protein D
MADPLDPATPPGPPSPFAQIRHTTDEGDEYWSARELAELLGYPGGRGLRRVIDRARVASANSGQPPAEHFVDVLVPAPEGGRHKDIYLSRYACYLIIQNADPHKEIVALGQTYFAVQTRRQEQQADALAGLTEAQKRLYLRGEITTHNRLLAATAAGAGVIHTFDFAIFMDHGYIGLYGGLRARDIRRRKGLEPDAGILDYMGSEELAANLFRATQAEAKIRREGITGKEAANDAHYEVGREVRTTIGRLGGTMPEDLPTPSDSIQQLRQGEAKRTKQGPQLSMFDEGDAPNQESE